MSISKMDMNELSDAVEAWHLAYRLDAPKDDPADLIMDGSQDERVLWCAATILRSAGAEVDWD